MKYLPRILITVAVAAAAAVGALPAAAQEAPPAPPVGMASGIVFELGSGRILWARDENAPRAPASLTKMMTAFVVLEEGKLDDTAAISGAARSVDGGRMFAEQGWVFSVKDLLWGLLLQSGNDAAIALAEKYSPDGSVPGFASLMTERAKELGATNSNFINPHGLDEPNHVSTAKDLAVIAAEAMKNPFFAEIVAAKTHDVAWGDGKPHTFINHNKLLFRYPGAVGIKTGFTAGAGNSLASAASRDGTTLVAIVLGSADHYADSIALYDWGFAHIGALKRQPLGLIVADNKQVEKSAGTGLEIVQVESHSGKEDGGIPPALGPILALTGACCLWVVLRRRRRRPFKSVDDFRETLQVLASGQTSGSHNGSTTIEVHQHGTDSGDDQEPKEPDAILPGGRRGLRS